MRRGPAIAAIGFGLVTLTGDNMPHANQGVTGARQNRRGYARAPFATAISRCGAISLHTATQAGRLRRTSLPRLLRFLPAGPLASWCC